MDNCPQCGCSYALVGRVHNCRPRVKLDPFFTDTDPKMQARIVSDLVKRGLVESQTYKYRDKPKRQVQVAAAMRLYRLNLKRKRNGTRQATENGSQA